jgi:hypothetical protein
MHHAPQRQQLKLPLARETCNISRLGGQSTRVIRVA